VWNPTTLAPYSGYAGLTGTYYFYMRIYIQQANLDLLPSTNSSWYAKSGVFVIAEQPPSSSSTSTIDVFSTSVTTSSTSTAYAGGGPTSSSSAGAGARKAAKARDSLG
jgi:outer membrane protein TolC